MEFRLLIQKENQQSDVLSIKDFPATFGRGTECTYTLLEPGVSRLHFVVKQREGNFILQDLHSTNGTYLNGKEVIEEVVLQDKDVIEAGVCAFQVSLADTQLPHFNGYQTSIIIPGRREISMPKEEKPSVPLSGPVGLASTFVMEGTKEKLLHSHRALRTMYVVLEQCTEEDDPKLYLDRLVQSLCRTIGADRSAVVFQQANGQNYVKSCAIEPSEVPIPGIVLKAAVGSRSAILSLNPKEDSRYNYLSSPWVAEVKTFICAPLISHKKVFGAVYLDRVIKGSQPFTEEDIELLSAIGVQVGSILEKSFLLEEFTRVNSDLHKTNEHLQKALVELKRTQEQSIQQERMHALGEMASGIAHDFNNALTAITGYTELLLHDPMVLQNKEETINTLELIRTAANDGADIVARLREFYRPRQDESFTSLNLNHLVEKAVLLTQPRWKDQSQANNIKIAVETKLGNIPKIIGNNASIRQMLINLIFNSIDALPHGGTIGISTSVDEKNVALVVADTGIGMSKEVLARCMEPFFSTKKERGTGLGLSMVYGIVQRHSGTIEIQSEPEKGTSVTIRFPILMKIREEGETVPSVRKPLSHLRILFVDDDPLVRDVVRRHLTNDGHTVEVANNGVEGLQKFFKESFELVITDQAMPEMSGEHMSISMKQLKPDTPILLLTGFGEMMEVTREKPLAVDMVLKKPCSIEMLREAIARVVLKKVRKDL